jgi:hypothetical protein
MSKQYIEKINIGIVEGYLKEIILLAKIVFKNEWEKSKSLFRI